MRTIIGRERRRADRRRSARRIRACSSAPTTTRAGVTAEFNLNALRHLNRELGADFDLDAFEHRAVWVEDQSRIEMHLVSKRDQVVHLGEEDVDD